ncbi:SdrD B-like domain-containing protein [Listeria booriae]|uniref:BIG2 domain-containing protein n=1 Tax=Listeria booriae TaxID=1552123 RepID=A0A7X0Y0U8_9LIST|nr:SdrD B-like domain-containing protein [Listeria booriae]MBC1794887.1 hypothetical protein [Listeria booriae]
MYKKTMKKWGLGAITGVLVLGSLTPIIQPYTTVSAAENTIKQLKASGQGTISDVMFEDLNGNSVQDSNETTGVAGIKVELYNDQGTLVSTSTTGTDGRYTFSNVPDGTYYLHVDMSTLPSDEKLYTTQGINGADGNSSYFTISGGNTITGFHFGFYPQQGAIQSFVYNDTNKNGQKDSGEAGISGVHIALYNEAGSKVADATTDSSGAYSFTAVKPGKYYAKADIPSDYKYQSSTYFGADGTTGYFSVASEQTLHNELNLGLSTLNNSAVSGTVTDAATGSGLANTRVELHDVQGNLIDAQQTDASGHYNFTGLAAGDYYTKVVIPSDYDFVSSNGFGSDGNSNYIQLNGENTSSNYSIALKKQVKDNSEVSGTVTDATTSNGLANIRVELHDVQGNLVDSQQTDASGHYNFTGLAAGDYYTKVVIPNNYDFASSNGFGSDGNSNYIQLDGQNTSSNYTIALKKQAKTTISGVINTPSGQGVSENVSLYNVDGTLIKTVATNSQGNFSFDGISEGNYYVKASIPEGYTFESSQGFGSDGNSFYLQADGTSNISNLRLTLAQKTGQIRSTVFNDLNKNGTQEAGETGVAGATVTLYSNTGAVVETTTTDANGLYKFETITPGTYYVKVTAPTGYDVLANSAFGGDGVSGYIDIAAQQTRTDMNSSLVEAVDPTAVANAKWIYHNGFTPDTDLANGGTISVSNTYKDGYNNDNVDVAFYNSADKIVDPSSYTWTLSNPDLFTSVQANGTHIAFTHTEKTGSSLVTVKDASGKTVRTFTITITGPENVPATDISLSASNITAKVADTGKINATVAPSTATNKNLTYTPADPSIISVDENGNWTAKKAGTTTIAVATEDGSNITKTITVNVSESVVVKQENIPNYPADVITEGKNIYIDTAFTNTFNSHDMNFREYDTAGNVLNGSDYIYTSSDTSVLAPKPDQGDNWNRLAVVGAGTATITVKDKAGNTIRTFIVHVAQAATTVPVTDISLSATNIAAKVADTGKINATVAPSTATNKNLTYTPADPSIISVDANGNWTAKKAGTTTIAVATTDGSNITKTITVNVSESVVVKQENIPNYPADVITEGKNIYIDTNFTNTFNSHDMNFREYDTAGNVLNGSDYIYTSSDTSVLAPKPDQGDNWNRLAVNGAGTATITVKDKAGNTIRTFIVHVAQAATTVPVTDISLSASNIAAKVADTGKITATVAPSTATNKNLTYTPADPSIISVDANGNWTAKKAGTTTIAVATADGSNITKTITVNVSESVVVKQENIPNYPADVITEGKNIYIDTAFTNTFNSHDMNFREYDTAGNVLNGSDYIYTSSDTSVLSPKPDQGDNWNRLAVNGAGTATITVKDKAGNTIRTFIVHVAQAATTVAATGLTLDASSITANVADTGKINATVAPTNATNKNVSYTPADASIISVDANGNWTANKAGTTTITVKTLDGSNISKTINVTVAKSMADRVGSADFEIVNQRPNTGSTGTNVYVYPHAADVPAGVVYSMETYSDTTATTLLRTDTLGTSDGTYHQMIHCTTPLAAWGLQGYAIKVYATYQGTKYLILNDQSYKYYSLQTTHEWTD